MGSSSFLPPAIYLLFQSTMVPFKCLTHQVTVKDPNRGPFKCLTCLTKTDVHSLGKNRVNVTLRNIDTFHKAFGITEGAMFLPEEERIIIW